jgi:hypothetical protein
MEMETEDDVALEGSIEPPSSAIPSIMTQEFQPETGDKALGRDEELVALS